LIKSSDNDGVATTRMTDRFRSKISRKPNRPFSIFPLSRWWMVVALSNPSL
jgi:hypothetical protein